MRISLNAIPGLQESIKRETDIRDAAFLDLTTDICGIPIRQMTAEDLIILDGVDDPILNNRVPQVDQLAAFLWLMSPRYRPHAPVRAWLFARQVRKLPYITAVARCFRYVGDTFQDEPGRLSALTRPYVGWCAHLVDTLAREYGWQESVIVRMPLKRVFQYLKCIRRWHDPKCVMHNPSDKDVGKYLKLLNARMNLLNALRNRCN